MSDERRRAQFREWYYRNRESCIAKQTARRATDRAYLDAIKLERGCVDCGYAEHAEALEFDHVGDDKVIQVSNMVAWSRVRIDAEIAKCEVVCANCHRVRTHSRRVHASSH